MLIQTVLEETALDQIFSSGSGGWEAATLSFSNSSSSTGSQTASPASAEQNLWFCAVQTEPEQVNDTQRYLKYFFSFQSLTA